MGIVMHVASIARHKTYTLVSRRHLVKHIRYFCCRPDVPMMPS